MGQVADQDGADQALSCLKIEVRQIATDIRRANETRVPFNDGVAVVTKIALELIETSADVIHKSRVNQQSDDPIAPRADLTLSGCCELLGWSLCWLSGRLSRPGHILHQRRRHLRCRFLCWLGGGLSRPGHMLRRRRCHLRRCRFHPQCDHHRLAGHAVHVVGPHLHGVATRAGGHPPLHQGEDRLWNWALVGANEGPIHPELHPGHPLLVGGCGVNLHLFPHFHLSAAERGVDHHRGLGRFFDHTWDLTGQDPCVDEDYPDDQEQFP